MKIVPQRCEVTVETLGVWLAVTDATGLLASADFRSDAIDTRDRRAQVELATAAGDAIDWTTVLDGTFRVRLVFLASEPGDVTQRGERLSLPTGRLVIVSFLETVAVEMAIAPGAYGVVLEWFADEESKHYDISRSEYPSGDGPDGIVTLRPWLAE